MTTKCSGCGRQLEEKENDRYCICKLCNRFTPKGANSYMSKNSKNLKGGKKMAEEKLVTKPSKEKKEKPVKVKKEKKDGEFGKSTVCVCSKCKKPKFTRQEVYDARVKKFGSVEALKKGYVCRDCKKLQK